MSPSGPSVYLGGGSWIVSGPVIDGAISGEVGAAGAAAGAAAAPGGAPAGGAASGGAVGAGAEGSWARSSAHALAGPGPSKAMARATPEMVFFLVLFICAEPFE